MTLPDAMVWGYLDESVLARILARTIPMDGLTQHLRGSCLLADAAAQVADVLFFEEYGWEWLARDRQARVASIGDETRVEIAARDRDGVTGVGFATLRRTGLVTVPGCRESGSSTTDTSWMVLETGTR